MLDRLAAQIRRIPPPDLPAPAEAGFATVGHAPISYVTDPVGVVEPVEMWVRRQACPSYPRAAQYGRPPPVFDGRGRKGAARCCRVDPVADDPFGFEAVGRVAQVHRLVLERTPRVLGEHILHALAWPILGNRDTPVLEDTGELEDGDLIPRMVNNDTFDRLIFAAR